jgi:predicted ATPase
MQPWYHTRALATIARQGTHVFCRSLSANGQCFEDQTKKKTICLSVFVDFGGFLATELNRILQDFVAGS